MNIETIDLFCDVARLGSFAKAARARNIDPSVVSRQIARMEQALNVTLFHRSTRTMTLSEAGRILFARLEGPRAEIDAILDAARDSAHTPTGPLRISASVAFSERWLLPRVLAFADHHPGLVPELIATDASLDLAAEGIDVAIRLGPRPSGPNITRRLMPTRYLAVASPAYLDRYGWPNTPEDLSRHRVIMFALPGFSGQWQVRAPDASVCSVALDPVMTSSNALVIRRAVLDGAGLALLADWTVHSDLASGDLSDVFPAHELTPSVFDTAAWVLYPTHTYLPLKTRLFIDHLKQSL